MNHGVNLLTIHLNGTEAFCKFMTVSYLHNGVCLSVFVCLKTLGLYTDCKTLGWFMLSGKHFSILLSVSLTMFVLPYVSCCRITSWYCYRRQCNKMVLWVFSWFLMWNYMHLKRCQTKSLVSKYLSLVFSNSHQNHIHGARHKYCTTATTHLSDSFMLILFLVLYQTINTVTNHNLSVS